MDAKGEGPTIEDWRCRRQSLVYCVSSALFMHAVMEYQLTGHTPCFYNPAEI